MCDASAMMALNIGQGATGFLAAQDAADAQEKYQEDYTESIIQATLKDEAAILQNERAAKEDLARQSLAAARDARRVRAQSILRMATSGQAGKSAGRVLDDLIRQGENTQVSLEQQNTAVQQSTQGQLGILNDKARSQIANVNQPIERPNIGTALLGIGSAIAMDQVAADAAQAKAAGVKQTSGLTLGSSETSSGGVKVGRQGSKAPSKNNSSRRR